MKLISNHLSKALIGTLLAIGTIRAAPIIEYRFNESGTIAVNSGTLGVAGNGVLHNISHAATQPFGAGTSIELNGSNSFVRVQKNFAYGGQMTVEAWIKPAFVGGQQIIWD